MAYREEDKGACCIEDSACCGEYRSWHGPGPFFGRLLLSLIFIIAGIGKIATYPAVVDFLHRVGIERAEIWLGFGIVMELIGGFLILFGWYTRIGVYILMIFLLPVTLLLHGFWNYSGVDMVNQLGNFLKNLAIYGGLLLLLSYGPGRWSIDATLNRHKLHKHSYKKD